MYWFVRTSVIPLFLHCFLRIYVWPLIGTAYAPRSASSLSNLRSFGLTLHGQHAIIQIHQGMFSSVRSLEAKVWSNMSKIYRSFKTDRYIMNMFFKNIMKPSEVLYSLIKEPNTTTINVYLTLWGRTQAERAHSENDCHSE